MISGDLSSSDLSGSHLKDIAIFVAVAKANGFRAAGESLGLSASSVSEAVQRCESLLSQRLFDRTTRRISLTAAGKQLYEQSLPALTDLERVVESLQETNDLVSGTLRLNAPPVSGPFFMDGLIEKYMVLYPETNIEITYTDERVDLVTSGLDAVIRPTHLLEQDTYAVPIGPEINMTVVASPEYLKVQGTPETPGDLLSHHAICYSVDNAKHLGPWVFKDQGSSFVVKPKPRMIVNDVNSLLRYTVAGIGLAYIFAEPAKPLLKSGRLVEVLKGQVPSLERYTINYLSRKHVPARLRAFIDLASSV